MTGRTLPWPAHPLDGFMHELVRLAADSSKAGAVLEVMYDAQSDEFKSRIRYLQVMAPHGHQAPVPRTDADVRTALNFSYVAILRLQN